MSRLGIMAGGGDLPVAIVESALRAGRDIFVLRLPGADQDFSAVPHDSVSGMGELGKTLSLLHKNGCETITMAGRVSRPEWKSLKLDTRGILAMPGVIASALKGDDALMRHMIALF